MILGIGTEGSVFLYAVLSGMSVLAAYQVLTYFRRLVRHSRLAAGAEDLLFWLCVSGYIFARMYETTYGSIRWFFVLGLLCGAGACQTMLRLAGKMWNKLKKNLEKRRKTR